jgi:predicted ATPase
VRLRWRQVGSDTVFGAEALSDGTLRFICLSTLLLQANPPELLILDEPELGLHPAAIVYLVEMLRAAATAGQVVVATQSVTLLDQLSLDEIVVVERSDGASVFKRPDEESLRGWVEDYSVGELWLKNLVGGRPVPERLR